MMNRNHTSSEMMRAEGQESSEHTGRGWHGDAEGHAEAGRKGGQTVAQDREHMAAIGRKGGQAVSRDRRHMAEIGRRGGKARGATYTQGASDSANNSTKRS
jgi:general stress protein YciG